jgi:hypothetical protein
MTESSGRVVDGGGPTLFFEHDPPPPCGHGVCVETRFDDLTQAADEITLAVRRAERHDGGPAALLGDPILFSVSLATAECSPRDTAGVALLAEHRWLPETLAAQLQWLRDRAERAVAQRDRTSCVASLARAATDAMIPHDELFPADWDLVFTHEGRHYWAVLQHCPNALCPCTDIVVVLHHLHDEQAPFVGELRIDVSSTQPTPKASNRLAAELFKPLWARHGHELRHRFDEVRGAVRQHAAARAVASVTRRAVPGRNAPCPCGSGKKYKRCCADRDAIAARASR